MLKGRCRQPCSETPLGAFMRLLLSSLNTKDVRKDTPARGHKPAQKRGYRALYPYLLRQKSQHDQRTSRNQFDRSRAGVKCRPHALPPPHRRSARSVRRFGGCLAGAGRWVSSPVSARRTAAAACAAASKSQRAPSPSPTVGDALGPPAAARGALARRKSPARKSGTPLGIYASEGTMTAVVSSPRLRLNVVPP